MTNCSSDHASTKSNTIAPATWMVVASLAIGVFVRLDNVNRKSLWIDEAFTYNRFALANIDQVLTSLEGTLLAPPYYVALWYWGRLVGVSDTTLRLLPAALGVLTLPLTYLVWRPLIGQRAAGWALVLLSVSACHVWFSLDAKMYGAVWLLATLSCGSFLNVLQNKRRRPEWLLVYGLTTACLPLLNYTAIAVVVVQVVFGIGLYLTRPERRPRIVRSWLVLFLAIVPFVVWLPVIFNAARNQYEIQWIPAIRLRDVPGQIIRLYGNFLFGYQYGDSQDLGLSWAQVPRLVYIACALGILGFVGYSLIGIFRARRHESGDERSDRADVLNFLALWVTVPVIGCLVYSVAVSPMWGIPRYLVSVAAGLILWLATVLVDRCGQRFALTVLAAVVGINVAILWFDRINETRVDWRGIARTIGIAAAVIDARDVAHGTDPLRSGARSPVQVVGIRKNEGLALRHAALTDGVPIELGSLKRLLENRQDFFYVSTTRSVPTRDLLPEVLTPAIAGFNCRPIFAKTFYEKDGGCLIPGERLLAEVWICSPRDPPLAAVDHGHGPVASQIPQTTLEKAARRPDGGLVHTPEQNHEH